MNSFWDGVGAVTVGAIIGAIITAGFTWWYDKKRTEAELIATYYSISFYLAVQISELFDLKKNILDREENIKKITENPAFDRNTVVKVTQDFNLYKNININIENISKIILSAKKKQRVTSGVIQSIFISNKNYFKCIKDIEAYQSMKRSLPDDEKYFPELINFLKSNLPAYGEIINKAFCFSKQTLDSFGEEVYDKLKIKISRVEDEIKLD